MMSPHFDSIHMLAFEKWFFFVLSLLLASFVVADSRLKLQFPEEFYHEQLEDKKLNRNPQLQKENDDQARQWQKSKDQSTSDYRWKGIEFHYNDSETQTPSVLSDLPDHSISQNIDIKPQFELRF